MKESRFKEGDIVVPTIECIEEGVLIQAHIPKKKFIRGKQYIVKTVGQYESSNSRENNYNVLVEGSTQFIPERYFELVKTYNMVEVENIIKSLVKKDVIIKAVEEKKAMAEDNASAHFADDYDDLPSEGQAEWEGLVNGWNDALYYVIEMLKD